MQGWWDPMALVPGSAVQKAARTPLDGLTLCARTEGWSQVPGYLPPNGPRHPQPHCTHCSAPLTPALCHPNAASLRDSQRLVHRSPPEAGSRGHANRDVAQPGMGWA